MFVLVYDYLMTVVSCLLYTYRRKKIPKSVLSSHGLSDFMPALSHLGVF